MAVPVVAMVWRNPRRRLSLERRANRARGLRGCLVKRAVKHVAWGTLIMRAAAKNVRITPKSAMVRGF